MAITMQEIVTFFCDLGIPLLPCYGIDGGQCTCKRGSSCPSPGKHPLMSNWQKVASMEPAKVMKWLRGKKPVNLAICTGRWSKVTGKFLVVVDGDIVAHPFLQRLARHSTTVTQRSGSGGDHAFYWSNFPVKNSCQMVDEKVDIRGTGGLVVIAPSLHKNGKRYEFTCDLKSTTIQEVPEFLEKKLRITAKKKEKKAKGEERTVISTRSSVSENAKLWQNMSITMIREKMASGTLIPCGVRNMTMHRLLSSERAHGASEEKLRKLALEYLRCFEDSSSFKNELESIVQSVAKYPSYDNTFEKVNELYLGWLAKKGYEAPHDLKTLKAFDDKFFSTLEETTDIGTAMTLKEIAIQRKQYMKSQGLDRFATYKPQMLAQKLLSLGFVKKRTKKGNFWMVKNGVQTSTEPSKVVLKDRSRSMETLNMSGNEQKEDSNNSATSSSGNSKKGLKDGDVIVHNGRKVRVEVIKSQEPVKQHSREHLYMGQTGYEYNKAMMALLSRITEEQMDLLERNELVMDKEKTLSWINTVKPGDIIGVLCRRYRVNGFNELEGTQAISVVEVKHVQGNPGEFSDVGEDVEHLSLPRLDHARELNLLDILWRDKKPYGEPGTKDMNVILLHDVEEASNPQEDKRQEEEEEDMNGTLGRSFFTGMAVEYSIPKSTKVVFVNDYFVREVAGGAELTSEAIIKKSPYKVFRLHSNSANKKLLDANKDKYWIFGNFASMSDAMIRYLPDAGIRYSIVEYDFKFCAYRSTNRHQQATGQPCNCAKETHGLFVARVFQKADKIFWMSSGQKDHWLKHVPELVTHPGHMVLSSVFDDETLDILASYRKGGTERKPLWATLGSGSWIKGVEETQKWCTLKRYQFEPIPNLPYKEFLRKLSEYKGLIFMPLDRDTCPRVTLEAKLMGLEVMCNENVLQKHDDWFKGTPEGCENYLRTRGDVFWSQFAGLC